MLGRSALIPPPTIVSLASGVVVPIPTLPEKVEVENVEVPTNVDVPDTPRFSVARRVPSKVRLVLSINRPPAVIKGTRPVVSPRIARLVVVALVTVALVPIMFAKLVVPVNVGAADNTKLPVPVTPATSVKIVSSWAMVVKALDSPSDDVAI